MTIPFTSVSLGFNSQIEPWRQQLHKDPAAMLALFGITPASYEHFLAVNEAAGSRTIRKELPRAEDMVKTALVIERESAKIRANHGTKPDPELSKLIEDFLKMTASWMTAEVALGITAPDVPIIAGPGQLIRRLYLALYSSDFRQHPDRGDFDEVAWTALLKAVNDGKAKFDDLLPHCWKLCGAVAQEFSASQWNIIW
jgi:hypothetical protein